MSTTHDFASNRTDAAEFVAPFAESTLGHVIGGKDVPGHSGETFTNTSPIDGAPLGDVALGDGDDVDAAVAAANEAFDEWRQTSPEDRQQVLRAIADRIVDHGREIALVECVDTGQTIRFMSAAAARGAENFRYFADRIPTVNDGHTLPDRHHLNYTRRSPIGTVGVITPWNTPFMLATWKIAPALAAGCTVVHKPAEWSPLTATMLARIALDAGLPPGVLNVVNGVGETTGRMLTESPGVAAIAFIGESATGSRIQAQSAPALTRLHFELGGKNAIIVFGDADLDRALDAVLFMIYSLNGERCTSASRLLVDASIAPEFLTRLSARLDGLHVGHPLDPDTVIGPLVHPRHAAKVRGMVAAARDGGATVQEGSDVPTGGTYVAPTLITGVGMTDSVFRDEIFGPVLTAVTFEDEDEAVTLANDSEFGLAAYVWTGDVGRAHRVADAVNVGMVWVNSHNVRHLATPFGGVKRSGIGRDGGDWSFDFYTETKNVAVALGTHPTPTLGAH